MVTEATRLPSIPAGLRAFSDLSLAQRVAAERHISRTIVAPVQRSRTTGDCSAYRGLLVKLGVTDHAPLRNRFDVTVLDPDLQGRLCRTRFPALSYAVVPGRVPVSSLTERVAVFRPALAMLLHQVSGQDYGLRHYTSH